MTVYLFLCLRLCLCIFDSRSGREHDSIKERDLQFGAFFVFWVTIENDYNVHKVRAGLYVHTLLLQL